LRITDERGDKIEDFILANNLVALNQVSPFTTFFSHSGASNIDVTMSTIGIAKYVKEWHIAPDRSISDHTPSFSKSGREERQQLRDVRLSFNIKGANWDFFCEKIKKTFNSAFKNKLAFLPAEQINHLI